MTTPDAHARFAELAAGHALHALEPADEQAFVAHSQTCADCRLAVTEHVDTLSHLAYAAAPAELPAGILAGIRRGIAEEATPVLPTELARSAAPASLAAARDRRQGRRLAPAWIGVAAAAAMVLSLGVWNLTLHRDKTQAELRADRLAAAVATLEGGAKQRVQLTDASGHPVAIAVVRPNDTVSLVVDGLAPNDRRSSTYVLWQKGAYGVVRAVGTFDVRGPGVDVVANLPLARDVMGVQGFAVTREPGRRAPVRPGSAPVADGGLSA